MEAGRRDDIAALGADVDARLSAGGVAQSVMVGEEPMLAAATEVADDDAESEARAATLQDTPQPLEADDSEAAQEAARARRASTPATPAASVS